MLNLGSHRFGTNEYSRVDPTYAQQSSKPEPMATMASRTRKSREVSLIRRRLTTELSDAGGPARPNLHLTWPARVRSSDFVSQVSQTFLRLHGNKVARLNHRLIIGSPDDPIDDYSCRKQTAGMIPDLNLFASGCEFPADLLKELRDRQEP